MINSSFENLFRGATHLGFLFGILKIPWSTIVPFIQSFSLEMNEYLEFSIDENERCLGIMTKGKGKEFTFKIARLMEAHGIEKERLKRFLVLARFFEHRNIFFKVEVDNKGIAEFSYYFRRRPSVGIAQAWLKSFGVEKSALGIVDELAFRLKKKTVHFLASAESPDGQSLQKVYFTQPIKSDSFDKIQQASYLTGISEREWDGLKKYGKDFGREQLFISLSFCQGQLIPGIKLDIQNVDQQIINNIISSKQEKPKITNRYQLVFNLFQKKSADYLGLHIRPEQSIKTKIYMHMISEG